MNCLENCVFVDEPGFEVNMRTRGGWSQKGTPSIVITPTIRAPSYTVLEAISEKFLRQWSSEIRRNAHQRGQRSTLSMIKEKHQPTNKKTAPEDTIAGHYLHFIQRTIDEMDYFPEMKDY